MTGSLSMIVYVWIGSRTGWWMFRVFGHDKVAMLDGGYGK